MTQNLNCIPHRVIIILQDSMSLIWLSLSQHCDWTNIFQPIILILLKLYWHCEFFTRIWVSLYYFSHEKYQILSRDCFVKDSLSWQTPNEWEISLDLCSIYKNFHLNVLENSLSWKVGCWKRFKSLSLTICGNSCDIQQFSDVPKHHGKNPNNDFSRSVGFIVFWLTTHRN